MRSLFIAVQFLTVVPVRFAQAPDEDELRGSVVMYPVVGLVIGCLGLVVYAAASEALPLSVAAALVLVAYAVVTGGLHLDGLSDTADGLSAQGAIERKLKAMRDPAAGPLGVAAIVFVLLIKYASLVSLAGVSRFWLFAALIVMPVMGRWAMVVAMAAGRPAQDNGLGRVYLGHLGAGRVIAALILTVFAVLSGMCVLRGDIASGAYWFMAASLALAAIVALALDMLFRQAIGGQSGDTLGATCELAETTFLMGALAWSKFYTL